MLRAIRITGVLAASFVVIVVVLRLVFPLPELQAENDAELPLGAVETGLAKTLLPIAAAHPGTSGILPLASGIDAFAARILLMRSATASIDAQYYIWQDDLTGIRLLAELQQAARRGVRVRLLVDDNGTPALDQELAALATLPAAEVRLFNPFTLRNHRLVNYAFDFFRLNRRMHNKSFTVDGIVTIVGGRNIGDVYFETGEGHTYIDLDVLAVGPAAADVTADFNRYWRSKSAYPVQSLISLQAGAVTRLDDRDAILRDTPQGRGYSEAVRASSFIDKLAQRTLPLEWVPTILFSDDPGKIFGLDDKNDLMIRQLMAEIGTPESSFDIISAYFIPGASATERMVGFATKGVRVRVLTNALEATDVVPVHSGYIDYRDSLLSGGIEVYELRSESGQRRTVSELGVFDFSKAALHAKSFAIDRRRAFIGSFNFDPRSKRLNTEMGLLIDSNSLAAGISEWLDANLATLAYRVTQGSKGHPVWTAAAPEGQTTVFEVEPNTTLPLRLLVGFFNLLPIQWLL